MVVLSSGGFGMRLVGLAISLFFVFGALITVGPSLYFDILSLALVVGGGVGFALLRGDSSNYVENFGNGAVYFGWIGTLIGLIAIAGGSFNAISSLDKFGAALAVSMLTIFYGYLLKLVTLAFSNPE
jgi:flagellar motor component MotA